MSIFGVEQVLWDISRSKPLADSFRTDPEHFLTSYRLDVEERRAILQLDVHALAQAGINPMLLMQTWNCLSGPDAIGEYLERMNGQPATKDKSHG